MLRDIAIVILFPVSHVERKQISERRCDDFITWGFNIQNNTSYEIISIALNNIDKSPSK